MTNSLIFFKHLEITIFAQQSNRYEKFYQKILPVVTGFLESKN
jgi:hypothetical protein